MGKNLIKPAIEGELIPFRDPDLLSEFLNQPATKIAEAITGALSLNKSEVIMTGGRIIQGAIKGKAMKQLGRELKELIERGKIKEDYAETKYGFKSLAEILEYIDQEFPDEDRLIAVKALFFSIISKKTNEAEEIKNYQLFQMVKKLTSSQLLLLKAIGETYISGEHKASTLGTNAHNWLKLMASKIGHNITDLIENDEIVLVENRIITPRQLGDKSAINPTNARLTDLGININEIIETYKPKN